ncbi:MAG TPA: hypothetical protein VN958_01385 [Chitinophagaceae bacterium]|nr:hypothetical protein [Chitinophagaceae bacterium]
MKKIFVFAAFVTTAACNTNNSIQTKAYIFERKMLSNGKLMVHYVFNAGKALFQDSSVIENKVLPQDSVIVQFKKEDPAESRLVE